MSYFNLEDLIIFCEQNFQLLPPMIHPHFLLYRVIFFFTKHINSQPNLFPSLTSTLFNLLLFGPPQNHWAVVKPMLSLMLASENSFTSYKEHLISTQTRENQHLLSEAFNKLLHDVQRSLDSANRDRFTQRLTAFRVAARSFLTL